MPVEFSIGCFFGRAHDCIPDALVQEPEIHICARGRELNQAHGSDKFAGESEVAYRKILNSTLSLRSIKRVGRNGHFSHRIALDPLISLSSSDRPHRKNPDHESEHLRLLNIGAESMRVRPLCGSCRRRQRRDATEVRQGIRASPLQPAADQYRRCGQRHRRIGRNLEVCA